MVYIPGLHRFFFIFGRKISISASSAAAEIVIAAPPLISDHSLPLPLPSVTKEELPDNEREKSPEKEPAAGEDAEMVRVVSYASALPAPIMSETAMRKKLS